MISLSSEMILSAVLFSLFLGLIFGFLYAAVMSLINLISNAALKGKKQKTQRKSLLKNAVDLLIVLALSIVHLLSGYVFLDGAFNVYSTLALLISSLISARLFMGVLGVKDYTVV